MLRSYVCCVEFIQVAISFITAFDIYSGSHNRIVCCLLLFRAKPPLLPRNDLMGPLLLSSDFFMAAKQKYDVAMLHGCVCC